MPQVNGDNLLHQQIVKRTIEALQAKDEAFAIEYETASDADLHRLCAAMCRCILYASAL
ncbi:MAG: hypothetical protein V8T09_02810 [Oscillospiraceae bacterium]